MNADQEAQEQARDYWRAKTTLERFFVKCETGMQTVDDVKEAVSVLRLFGVDLKLN